VIDRGIAVDATIVANMVSLDEAARMALDLPQVAEGRRLARARIASNVAPASRREHITPGLGDRSGG